MDKVSGGNTLVILIVAYRDIGQKFNQRQKLGFKGSWTLPNLQLSAVLTKLYETAYIRFKTQIKNCECSLVGLDEHRYQLGLSDFRYFRN